VCGAATAASPQVPRQNIPDRETLKFARAILNRPYKFTIAFLFSNLFVFMLMWESDGMSGQVLWQAFTTRVLIEYGAKLNSLVAAPYHEYWRFVTPMFIHVNLLHLAVNMYSLWIIGPYVEKLYGSAKFVVFWVLTGIAGVVASYLTVRPNLAVGPFGRFIFKAFDEPSAGASGALFGLVGVLFVFGIKYRKELPEGFKRAFGTGMLPVITINLFIGFLGRGFIDNAAHLGGLISGAALASVVSYRRPEDSQGSAIVWRVLQMMALLVVAVSFLQVVRHFNVPRFEPQAQNTPRDLFLNYVSAMNQAHETIAAVVYEGDSSSVDQTLQRLQSTPAPDAAAEELRTRLIALLGKTKSQPTASPSPAPGPRRETKLDDKLFAEFAAWSNDYNAWLKTTVQHLNQ